MDSITGGKPAVEFLNVEFAVVESRVADLLILHEDESMSHIDFQSNNRPEMAHRMGIHGLLASRGVSERLTMEFKGMGIQVEIDQNVFLRDIRDSALAQGRAEGKAEGKAEGMITLLRDLLRAKSGRLPKWADQRLEAAIPEQAELWAKKVLTGKTLEGILGRK